MTQMVFLLKRVSKLIYSWLALSLFGICCFLLFDRPLWGVAPSSSLKTWEIVAALLLSLQIVLSPLIESLIQPHLSARLRQRWVISVIEGCLFSLLVLLASLLLNSVWDRVLLIFQGPFVIALVSVTLVMMGFYIFGGWRFS